MTRQDWFCLILIVFTRKDFSIFFFRFFFSSVHGKLNRKNKNGALLLLFDVAFSSHSTSFRLFFVSSLCQLFYNHFDLNSKNRNCL